MDVEIVKGGILVIPETVFEKRYLQETFGGSKKLVAFLKYGLSLDSFVGLKVREGQEDDKQEGQ